MVEAHAHAHADRRGEEEGAHGGMGGLGGVEREVRMVGWL